LFLSGWCVCTAGFVVRRIITLQTGQTNRALSITIIMSSGWLHSRAMLKQTDIRCDHHGFDNSTGVRVAPKQAKKTKPVLAHRSSSSKDAPSNPRGIPYAPFVDNVEDYVTSRADVEGTLKTFQEMISYV